MDICTLLYLRGDGDGGRGLVSLIGFAMMAILTVQHVNDFLDVTIMTEMEVDRHDDEPLRIEFNVTMHALSCSHVSVDLRDAGGTVVDNITAGITAVRIGVDGVRRPFVRHRPGPLQMPHVIPPPPEMVQRVRNERSGEMVVLTPANLTELQRQAAESHRFLWVRFYAEWCPHSSESELDWSMLAAVASRPQSRAIVTEFSCTSDLEAARFCHEQGVKAYPTLRVFYFGGHDVVDDDGEAAGFPLADEPLDYVGPRSFPTLARFMHEFGHQEGDRGWTGVVESPQRSEACEVSGVVLVSRVPGQLLVAPESDVVSLNPQAVNVSHTVHGLRFVQTLPADGHANELRMLDHLLRPQVQMVAETEFLTGRADSAEMLAVKMAERRKAYDAMVASLPKDAKGMGAHNLTDAASVGQLRERFMRSVMQKKAARGAPRLSSATAAAAAAASAEATPTVTIATDPLVALEAPPAADAAAAAAAPGARQLLFDTAPEPRAIDREAAAASAKAAQEARRAHAAQEARHSAWEAGLLGSSRAYWEALKQRRAQLRAKDPAQLLASDRAAVERRNGALLPLFERRDDLEDHYDHLARSTHVTQYRRSTLEHHLKVIPMLYATPDADAGYSAAAHFFEYTVADRETMRGGVPCALFSYEVSPVRMVFRHKREPLADFVTQLCAVVGGVLTVTSLLDGWLFSTSDAIRRRLGKDS